MTEQQPTKAELLREVQQLRQACSVAYTWATFQGGIALTPEGVEKLMGRVLGKEKR